VVRKQSCKEFEERVRMISPEVKEEIRSGARWLLRDAWSDSIRNSGRRIPNEQVAVPNRSIGINLRKPVEAE
jgi:hypothetical protein